MVIVVDLRSSELKTWPFWRTRARGSAMICGYGCVGVVLIVGWCEGGVFFNATRGSLQMRCSLAAARNGLLK